MEKYFKIRRNGTKIEFCPPDAEAIAFQPNKGIGICKWTETNKYDPSDWRWTIRIVENGSKVAADLTVDGQTVFASLGLYIGSRGVLLALNTKYRIDRRNNSSVGKYEGECRRYDISVADLMQQHNAVRISHRCPKESSYYEHNGLNSVRVFNLDGEEQKPLDSIFTLDESIPYVLHHSRVQGNKRKEWKSVFIPKGWKGHKPEKPEYDHPAPAEQEKQVAAEPAPSLSSLSQLTETVSQQAAEAKDYPEPEKPVSVEVHKPEEAAPTVTIPAPAPEEQEQQPASNNGVDITVG